MKPDEETRPYVFEIGRWLEDELIRKSQEVVEINGYVKLPMETHFVLAERACDQLGIDQEIRARIYHRECIARRFMDLTELAVVKRDGKHLYLNLARLRELRA